MSHRISIYSPRQRQDDEQKSISGAQRRRRSADRQAWLGRQAITRERA